MIGSVPRVNENDAPAAAPDLHPGDSQAPHYSNLPNDLDVLIAASQVEERSFLRRLLKGRVRENAIREASNVPEAASMARRRPPGILILSDRLPDGGADEVLLRLTVARGTVLCATVVLCASPSPRLAIRMLRLGAGDCRHWAQFGDDPGHGAAVLEGAIVRARELHRLSRRAALYRANTLIKRRRERVALDEAEYARREAERARERLGLAVEGAELGTWDWYPATGRGVHDDRLLTMLGY